MVRDKELTDPKVRERILQIVTLGKTTMAEAFANLEREMGDASRLNCLAMISGTAEKFKKVSIGLAINIEDAKAAGKAYKQRASLEFGSADWMILAQLVTIGLQAVTVNTLQKVLDTEVEPEVKTPGVQLD